MALEETLLLPHLLSQTLKPKTFSRDTTAITTDDSTYWYWILCEIIVMQIINDSTFEECVLDNSITF